MNVATMVLTSVLLSASAEQTSPLQKQFSCSGPLPENRYGAMARESGLVPIGSITVRLDTKARMFAITKASSGFGALCNVWGACDGAERSIAEIKSNAYVLVKEESLIEGVTRTATVSLDRMKPALTFESIFDIHGKGGVTVNALLQCVVTDVVPDKPLY